MRFRAGIPDYGSFARGAAMHSHSLTLTNKNPYHPLLVIITLLPFTHTWALVALLVQAMLIARFAFIPGTSSLRLSQAFKLRLIMLMLRQFSN